MKLHRRSVLYGAAGAIALLVRSPIVSAQAYPTRSVHLIVGFPAGFAPDIIARLTAQSLSERLGQQVIVDNRPGAASNIGTELVVRALPDGYTLLGATGANAINATLFENLNFNFMRDTIGRKRRAITTRHDSEPIGSGQHRFRVHCLCEEQSRQT